MKLKTSKIDFSIFLFDENPVQARFLKEMLVRQKLEAQFYTSEELLVQAIYLTLPHIVVLPSNDKTTELIERIHQTSSEIQVFVFGSSSESERMHRLLEQGKIFDYILDPVQFPAQFTHRIQRGMESWTAVVTQEKNEFLQQELQRQQHAPLNASGSKLDFIEDTTAAINTQNFRDELGDLLLCESEDVAVQFTLKRLQDKLRKNFVYLKYDETSGHLLLKDVATGMTQDLHHLGIKIENVEDRSHFFQQTSTYKVWSDFFATVFKCSQTQAYPVKGKDVFHGLVVALGTGTQGTGTQETTLVETTLINVWTRALGLIVDNHFKTRLIYDYLPVELKTFCLNNKSFYERLNGEISRARRYTTPLSTLSFVMQGANDNEIQMGQQLLAKILKRFTRVSDFVGRFSDSKMAVALPQTPLDKAAFVASRLQTIVQKALADKNSSAVVLCGASEFPSLASDAMSLLEGSEEACSQAEAFGVVFYTLASSEELELHI